MLTAALRLALAIERLNLAQAVENPGLAWRRGLVRPATFALGISRIWGRKFRGETGPGGRRLLRLRPPTPRRPFALLGVWVILAGRLLLGFRLWRSCPGFRCRVLVVAKIARGALGATRGAEDSTTRPATAIVVVLRTAGKQVPWWGLRCLCLPL